MRCEESSFNLSEKDAISILVCVYFPLTLWVKISLTITPSEYVPAHPMLHHQVESFILNVKDGIKANKIPRTWMSS
ncbi:hypothetical protein EI555_005786 [Monodon monoceros]|uniref:Uncharacterized protein n=1 Tax=Monodon monoceros TaxID=40151 RepID=A0A4U1EJL5_MONMO|nr:hypothetical protein EI555_005786 [Monodon monoceros]